MLDVDYSPVTLIATKCSMDNSLLLTYFACVLYILHAVQHREKWQMTGLTDGSTYRSCWSV